MKLKKISRRRFLAALGVTLARAPFAAAADASLIEPTRLKVRRLRVGTAAPAHRFVHFTDLHYKGDRAYAETVVRTINSLSPDFVCFTGDIMEKGSFLPEALEILSGIQAPMFGVPGNHEFLGACFLSTHRQNVSPRPAAHGCQTNPRDFADGTNPHHRPHLPARRPDARRQTRREKHPAHALSGLDQKNRRAKNSTSRWPAIRTADRCGSRCSAPSCCPAAWTATTSAGSTPPTARSTSIPASAGISSTPASTAARKSPCLKFDGARAARPREPAELADEPSALLCR